MHNTILIAILIVSAYSATDLSTSNCPSQFNITTANVTNSNGAAFRSFFFSAYSSQQHIDRVEKIVISANQSGDLQTYITEQALFFIPIGVASLILYIIIVCCCVFEKSCPPCQSWRRDFIRRPYTKLEMRCVMFFAIFFAVLIMGISIYAFTIIPGSKSDIENTKCSIFTMLDTTINGDSANNWGGFTQLKNQIGNISSLLSSAATQISTYLPGDRWLIDDMTIMKKANLDIYKQYKDSQLITPSPNQTAATTPGNPLPNVDSVFIKTGLGPNGTFNTMVNDIDVGLRTTEKLSNQAYFIDQASQQLVQSQATIQANTVASQNILEMYLNQLNSTVSNMQDFSSSSFDGYFTWFLYALQATVGFVLASSLLIILGTVASHFFSILQCRSMIHLGWVIYGIGHLFVIVLFMVCLSVGSIGHHTCGYFDKMLSNQTQFKRLGDSFSQNIFTKVEACFYGNGNVLESFGIAQQMKTVTDLFSNIVVYYDYEDSNSANFVDKTISTGKMTAWIATMENYRLGIKPDWDDLQTANTNPNFALGQLNKYTYQGGGVATCSKDRWVFDKTNCTNPTETTYTSTTSAANGQALTTTNVLCISFNEKFISTYPSWTQADFRRRYIQIKQTCTAAYTNIIAYGEALINYRDSRLNLFRGLKDDINALLTKNNNFNSLLTGFRSRVDQFYSSVSTLNNLVTNEIDGLLVTSDCRIIKDNLMFTYNSFCINFMDRVVGLGISSVLLILLMIGGLITANVFAVRVARMERDKRINALVDMSEASDNLRGNQRQKSEETSSSSDED